MKHMLCSNPQQGAAHLEQPQLRQLAEVPGAMGTCQCIVMYCAATLQRREQSADSSQPSLPSTLQADFPHCGQLGPPGGRNFDGAVPQNSRHLHSYLPAAAPAGWAI